MKSFFYNETDSTMLRALALLAAGEKPPFAAIAASQTAGSGRSGKSFFSPEGSGLYLTAVFSLDSGAEALLTVPTFAAAVATREALSSFGANACIKWVNDLLISHGGEKPKKCAGILCRRHDSTVHIGIGINLTPPSGGFPEDIKAIAEAVFADGSVPDKSAVAAALLDRLERVLAEDAESVLSRYRAACRTIGQKIDVVRGEKRICGTAVGIEPDGALAVETADGIQRLISGEI